MSVSTYIFAEEKAETGAWRWTPAGSQPPDWHEDKSRSWPWRFTQDRCVAAILGGLEMDVASEEPYQSITDGPRGLPSDLSQQLVDLFKEEETELDCFNWLLLAEFLAFNWEKKIFKRAMVRKNLAHHFTDARAPWPQEVPYGYSEGSNCGATVCWTETYAESVGAHFIESIRQLARRGPGAPEELRLIVRISW